MPIRLIVAAILIALQYFLFRRFWKWSRAEERVPAWLRNTGIGAFVVFNCALLVVSITGFRGTQIAGSFLYWGVYPFLFWHFSTFVVSFVLLITAVIKLPFKGAWAAVKRIPALRPRTEALVAHPTVQRFDASRRTFLRRSVYGLTAASFGGTAYGMLIERAGCDVSEHIMRIPGLPPEFSGYAIGLVTDVHSSIYMTAADMRGYVNILNGIGADMILVGGDMVNSSVDEVLPFADAFSALRAPDGVFGVLGNHDLYTRDPGKVASTATEAGVTILRDEARIIRRGSSNLTLLGIDDTATASATVQRIQRASEGAAPTGPRVLLSHRPYFLREAGEVGVDLMLSGHTHGGQVVLGEIAGITFTPAALASRFLAGAYSEDAAQLYVSRGIGTVGVPVRLNCPPELTRIVLQPA